MQDSAASLEPSGEILLNLTSLTNRVNPLVIVRCYDLDDTCRLSFAEIEVELYDVSLDTAVSPPYYVDFTQERTVVSGQDITFDLLNII